MRKFKGAIISFLILLLLIGGYYLLVNIDFGTEVEEEPQGETQEFSDVFTVPVEDVVYYEVDNSHGKFSLSLKDGAWVCNEDPETQLNQENVFQTVFSTTYYDAYTIADNEYNPSDFGLDNPTMVVKIKLKDDTIHTFTFGSLAPVDDYLYYMTIDERKTVYAIFGTKYDTHNIPIGALRDTVFFNFDYTGMEKISISGREKETIVIENIVNNESDYMSGWLMTQPYNKGVNEFTLANYIIDALAQKPVEISSYVSDNPDDLSVFGLDVPQYTISFTYADRTETIKLGNMAEGSTVFAMNSNSNSVYTVDYNYFSFVEYSAFEYIDKAVFFAVISDLKSFEIKDGNKTYKLTIPSDGEKYTLNGKNTSEKKVKAFYEELASLSISGLVKDTVTDSTTVTFTYEYLNGDIATIEFIPCGTRQYALKINGGTTDFYVKKSDVTNLISKIADL